MSFVLVISRDANCRRLYVDNLVRRGYIVVGVASADEAEKLLANVTPNLVLVCCSPTRYEQDIEKLRTKYQLTCRYCSWFATNPIRFGWPNGTIVRRITRLTCGSLPNCCSHGYPLCDRQAELPSDPAKGGR
jgi:hypothetical protein